MTIQINIPVFRTLYPQFVQPIPFPDVLIQSRFDMATGYVSPNQYGCMTVAVRTQALYLMTAHLLALGVIIAAGNYTGRPGVLQGATIDKVSVTLAAPPFGTSAWRYWLNLTPYGAELLALLDVQSVGGFYVGGLPERSAFRKVGGVF